MKTKTQKIVAASMFAALTCVATMIIKIPSPLKGYMNLGDCVVLFAGWTLSPVYSFLAAGIGSALADVLSGYVIYAPVTFFVKGVMALGAFYIFRKLNKKTGSLPSEIISGAAAEIIMILSYYIFEGFLYGFIPSLINVSANAIQGVLGLVFGIILVRISARIKF